MGKVLLDMAMSLDGSDTAKVVEEGFKTTGAIIIGRRSYDVGARQDGFADNPYQVPTSVLSSDVPKKLAKGERHSSSSLMVLRAPLSKQKQPQVTDMSW